MKKSIVIVFAVFGFATQVLAQERKCITTQTYDGGSETVCNDVPPASRGLLGELEKWEEANRARGRARASANAARAQASASAEAAREQLKALAAIAEATREQTKVLAAAAASQSAQKEIISQSVVVPVVLPELSIAEVARQARIAKAIREAKEKAERDNPAPPQQ